MSAPYNPHYLPQHGLPQPTAPGYNPYYVPIPVAMAPTANLMKNGLGTASLIFGIITLFFAPVTILLIWTGVVAVFAFGLPIAGIPMALFGLRRVNQNIATNKGVTVSGLVLNVVGLLLALFATLSWILSIASGSAT